MQIVGQDLAAIYLGVHTTEYNSYHSLRRWLNESDDAELRYTYILLEPGIIG